MKAQEDYDFWMIGTAFVVALIFVSIFAYTSLTGGFKAKPEIQIVHDTVVTEKLVTVEVPAWKELPESNKLDFDVRLVCNGKHEKECKWNYELSPLERYWDYRHCQEKNEMAIQCYS